MLEGTRHRGLRKGRVSVDGQIYLVTTTTRFRRRIFDDFVLACAASRSITTQITIVPARLLCWVLMPDHWHGVIELRDKVSLAAVMNRVKSVSAIEVNRVRDANGPVWGRAFHDHALRRDEDLVHLARYVIANPIRAGLVRRVGDYPFWDAIWLDPAADRPQAGSYKCPLQPSASALL